MIARSFVGSAAVGLTRFPIHVLICNPKRFDVHAVKDCRQTVARRCDLSTAGLMRNRVDPARRQKNNQKREHSEGEA
jgi:hypothetical protein